MSTAIFRYSILFILLIGLASWGEKAHRKINSSCFDFFPRKMAMPEVWCTLMTDHSTDPDLRRKTDKNEAVRHFIDIDLYDDFLATHTIPEDFQILCTKYGKERTVKDGTLPWVTDSTYRELVQNFKDKNWDNAVLTASDLGHYVADGFMPLHITGNYDGQLSNQKGIHSRYEGIMINKFIDQISLNNKSGIRKIKDIRSYIFKYLYNNHSYVGLLLQADSYAYQEAGNQYNEIYYERLWEKTNWFTIQLLQESSETLACFIFNAWLEAGKPIFPKNLKFEIKTSVSGTE